VALEVALEANDDLGEVAGLGDVDADDVERLALDRGEVLDLRVDRGVLLELARPGGQQRSA
jgi:hypothetical protein